MKTLLLDRTAWDLVLDASGNIALASDPYSVAQDVASAARLFKGELFYNKAPGIPYWEEILGERPPLSLVRDYLTSAALRVPRVKSANPVITRFEDRVLSGYIELTLDDGQTAVAEF